MRVLVTGSSGHLGEALVRTLRQRRHQVAGLDLIGSPFTTHVGSLLDERLVQSAMRGVDVVIHAATLHKPHIATHSRSDFVKTNVSGTLNVLEAALSTNVTGVVFTSTTSAFGAALSPADHAPAAWITEDVSSVPKNIYGVTKTAGEALCELFYTSKGLPSIVLRTSRFFMEEDDDATRRGRIADLNLKANEFLYRRVDLSDAVEAHLLAAERISSIGFGSFIISATTPFSPEHIAELRGDAPNVVRGLFPNYEGVFGRLGWEMLPGIDRVYVNRRAREELGWEPVFDFQHVLDSLENGQEVFSPVAIEVGVKGYHGETFRDGLYPLESSP